MKADHPDIPPRPTCVPPRIDAIPAELRERAQWVCWRFALDGKGAKWTKVPMSSSGGAASSTDPATWSTFDAAIAAYPALGCDGIGFVFSPDDPFAGIDLDDCIGEAGRMHPDAVALVKEFNTYTEISPSGTGAKLFVIGSKPAGSGCRKKTVEGCGEIEIYDSGRFFTVTGNRCIGTPPGVRDCTTELAALCAKHWPQRRSTTAAPKTAAPASDDDVLTSMFSSRNGAAIKRLFEGDTSGHGGDASAADMALCNHLAYWTRHDPGQIDRLFRRSKLIREKWDERRTNSTYGQMTISTALKGVRASAIGDAARPSSKKRTPRGFPHTDLGNAERMARMCADRLRFCHVTGRWWIWDGRRWHSDDVGTPLRCAGEVARAILQEAASCSNDEERHKLAGWAVRSESRVRLDAMVALARSRPELVIRCSEFDADPWSLNVLNGTIDLRDGSLRPHRREDLNSMLAPVAYDPEAMCPKFLAFLDTIFASNKRLIDFVQTLLGLCLSADVSQQILPIFCGSGANGKSVLLDTCMGVMGDYAALAPPSLLVESGSNQHPTEIADLRGRRLVVASETEDGAELKLQLVKRLTGDRTLKGRFMRQDFFEFVRTHKLVMVTNNRPRVRENGEAAWRRLRLVPFDVVIPASQRDPKLLESLVAEWPGIMAWLVRGCLTYRSVGLECPPEVIAATEAYRQSENELAAFIEDQLITAPQGTPEFAKLCVPWSQLVSMYQAWSRRTGTLELRPERFRAALDQLGYRSATRRFAEVTHKVRVGIAARSASAVS